MALAACGGSLSNSGGSGSACGTGSNTTAVQVVKLVPDANTVGAYDPNSVSVKVGESVQWVWQDPGAQHSVTADDGSFDSGLCNQGATFSFTFSKAGIFKYHCSIHAQMLGTVTVS